MTDGEYDIFLNSINSIFLLYQRSIFILVNENRKFGSLFYVLKMENPTKKLSTWWKIADLYFVIKKQIDFGNETHFFLFLLYFFLFVKFTVIVKKSNNFSFFISYARTNNFIYAFYYCDYVRFLFLILFFCDFMFSEVLVFSQY